MAKMVYPVLGSLMIYCICKQIKRTFHIVFTTLTQIECNSLLRNYRENGFINIGTYNMNLQNIKGEHK